MPVKSHLAIHQSLVQYPAFISHAWKKGILYIAQVFGIHGRPYVSSYWNFLFALDSLNGMTNWARSLFLLNHKNDTEQQLDPRSRGFVYFMFMLFKDFLTVLWPYSPIIFTEKWFKLLSDKNSYYYLGICQLSCSLLSQNIKLSSNWNPTHIVITNETDN
jgi:hypothetical protein